MLTWGIRSGPRRCEDDSDFCDNGHLLRLPTPGFSNRHDVFQVTNDPTKRNSGLRGFTDNTRPPMLISRILAYFSDPPSTCFNNPFETGLRALGGVQAGHHL